jgi:hypothetical protein
MSSIKRDVKKKAPPRLEEKIFCLEIQPTVCKCPSIAVERFCSGLFFLPMDVHLPVVTTPIES